MEIRGNTNDHLTPKIKNNLYLENLAWHFQILQPFSFYYWCPTRKFLACTVIITKNKQDEPGGAPAAPTAARRQPRTSASQNATTIAIRDTSYRLWLRRYIMGSPYYNDATPANAAKVCLQSLVVCLLQLDHNDRRQAVDRVYHFTNDTLLGLRHPSVKLADFVR